MALRAASARGTAARSALSLRRPREPDLLVLVEVGAEAGRGGAEPEESERRTSKAVGTTALAGRTSGTDRWSEIRSSTVVVFSRTESCKGLSSELSAR